jgi:hypothetical protein
MRHPTTRLETFAVPEPSIVVLLALGAGSLVVLRRRS